MDTERKYFVHVNLVESPYAPKTANELTLGSDPEDRLRLYLSRAQEGSDLCTVRNNGLLEMLDIS